MKHKNLYIQIIKGICVFLLFYYSALFRLIPIAIFHLDIDNLSNSMEVILNTYSNIILLLIIIIIYRKELIKEFKIFKEHLSENMDVGIKYWFMGMLGMMISNIILSIIGLGQAANEEAVQTMIEGLPWLMLIDAGIIGPFIEEIVFRKCFRNVFSNKWAFILTSGLVFGALHIISTNPSLSDWLFIIPYSSLGFAFAAMYEKTDTIYTSMSIHMLHNTLLVLVSIIK